MRDLTRHAKTGYRSRDKTVGARYVRSLRRLRGEPKLEFRA